MGFEFQKPMGIPFQIPTKAKQFAFFATKKLNHPKGGNISK
jgi:hypothetical protein